MRVSVIVTNYNYTKYIVECINSIRSSTFKDIELILVDDASTDPSSSLVCHSLEPDIFVGLGKNVGTAKASNIGVSVAGGEFCVFVNADDFIHESMLEKQVNALLASGPGVAFAYTDFWHKGVGRDGGNIDNGISFPEFNREELRKYNYILCSAMFRRNVFHEVGGFQVDYGMEDYDLWLRMSEKGYKGIHVPGYLYHYRAHECNRTRTIDVGAAMDKIKERNGIVPVKPKRYVSPVFSLLFASDRPWAVHSVISEWLGKATVGVDTISLEMIVAIESPSTLSGLNDRPGVRFIEVFEKNPVFAWNEAAKHARGDFLITVSDDVVPPENWDRSIKDFMANYDARQPYVVRFDDCTGLTSQPTTIVVTRGWIIDYGTLFYPGYHTRFAKMELLRLARGRGRLLQSPLLFEHVHPTVDKRNDDAVDVRMASLRVHDQKLFRWRQWFLTDVDACSTALPEVPSIQELYSSCVESYPGTMVTVGVTTTLVEQLHIKNPLRILCLGDNLSPLIVAAGLVSVINQATVTYSGRQRTPKHCFAFPITYVDAILDFDYILSYEAFDFVVIDSITGGIDRLIEVGYKLLSPGGTMFITPPKADIAKYHRCEVFQQAEYTLVVREPVCVAGKD